MERFPESLRYGKIAVLSTRMRSWKCLFSAFRVYSVSEKSATGGLGILGDFLRGMRDSSTTLGMTEWDGILRFPPKTDRHSEWQKKRGGMTKRVDYRMRKHGTISLSSSARNSPFEYTMYLVLNVFFATRSMKRVSSRFISLTYFTSMSACSLVFL